MRERIYTRKLALVYIAGLLLLGGCNHNDSDDTSSRDIVDTSPPVITLLGDNPVSLAQGATYTDAGASATDDVDDSVTVSSTGEVNTSVVGVYIITYTASDSAGNTANEQRTINVVMGQSRISKAFSYDSFGRVIEETLGGGRSIQYTYDDNGNLIQQTVVE